MSNTTAADLAAFLATNDYPLTVVGLPKTIDNDVIPVRQSLGAWTAAEQGAIFAKNIVPRRLRRRATSLNDHIEVLRELARHIKRRQHKIT